MREILFRGQRLGDRKWIEGFYVSLGEEYHYILPGKLTVANGFPEFVHYAVDPETVEQFTGLTDKNGKKIFEGDIVECMALAPAGYSEKRKGIVEWGTYGWVVNFGALEPWQGVGFLLVGVGCVTDIEVIGNIHDNPELLEV